LASPVRRRGKSDRRTPGRHFIIMVNRFLMARMHDEVSRTGPELKRYWA
jgi:hypothetical protein